MMDSSTQEGKIEPSETVPLQSISVDMVVQGFVADVASELHYENKETVPLEVEFVLPLDAAAAVCAFEGLMGGTQIEAQILEKEQAVSLYETGLASGQDAALFERQTKNRDIFRCMLGNLAAGGEATLKLHYVQALAPEPDGAISFVLPVVLNPRYVPRGSEEDSVTQSLPQVSEGHLPCPLSLNVTLDSPCGISHVESNCTLTPLRYTTEDHTTAQVSLAEGHHFDQDVELLIYYEEEVHKPSVLLEPGKPGGDPGSLMGDPVLLLTLYPHIPGPNSSVNATGEFLFLMDCSGSMSCSDGNEWNSPSPSRIQRATIYKWFLPAHPFEPHNNPVKEIWLEDNDGIQVTKGGSFKETLIFLLKSLPLGSYFNIYAFGANHYSFYPKSVKYTQETMLESLRRVKELQANLGGTEILQPLKAIYSQPCQEGYPRQLFVFTDGEITNTEAVIAEVQRHSCSHRCFSFGIGEGASTHLIKGIAQAAHGSAEFIKGKEKLQVKALQSMKKALQLSVTDVSLHWDLPPGLEAMVVGPGPMVIFSGQRCLIYAQISGQQQAPHLLEGSVTLQYSLGGQTVTETMAFSLQEEQNVRLPVHRLAAQALLQELERAGSSGKQGLALETSLSSGVLCSQTAYVVVNTEQSEPLQAPVHFRNVPGTIPLVFRCDCPVDIQNLPRRLLATTAMVEEVVDISRVNVDKVYERSYCLAGAQSFEMQCRPSRCKNMLRGIAEFSSKVYSSVSTMLASSTIDQRSTSSTGDFLQPQSVRFDQPTNESLLLMVISLQNADGSWSLDDRLLSILGLSVAETSGQMPTQVVPTAWATVLVILWLHAHAAEERETWELLKAKALDWLHKNAGPQLAVCVQAGNTFLGCDISRKAFGL